MNDSSWEIALIGRAENCQTDQEVAVVTLDAASALITFLENVFNQVFVDLPQPDRGAMGYFTRGIGTGKSAILLFREGLSEDASALVRVLLECTVRCKFLLSDEFELEVRLAKIEIDNLIFHRGINSWLVKLSKRDCEEDRQAAERLKTAEKRHRQLRHQMKKNYGIPECELFGRSSIGSYFRHQDAHDIFGIDYEYLSNSVHVNSNSLIHLFEMVDGGVRFSPIQPTLPYIVIYKLHALILELAATVHDGIRVELFSQEELRAHIKVFEAFRAKMKDVLR